MVNIFSIERISQESRGFSHERFKGSGIQRSNQRERGHIKDLYCLQCQEITKNIEIRYCDSFEEIVQEAEGLHKELYNTEVIN